MEADWEFEVGGDAPVIEACWPGFIDLRLNPQRARDLPEAVRFPALAAVLETLNSRTSSVWTSKCDFWPTLDADTFDPDELDAAPASCAHAVGCYIDLLPGGGQQWFHPHLAEGACRQICSILRQAPMRMLPGRSCRSARNGCSGCDRPWNHCLFDRLRANRGGRRTGTGSGPGSFWRCADWRLDATMRK